MPSNLEHAEEIARLYIRSARLRPVYDLKVSHSLLEAADLLTHHSPAKAVPVYEEAAARAMALGDVGTAARAYTRLVAVAFQENQRQRADMNQWAELAHRYAAQARFLAASPLIAEEDRRYVLYRIK